MCEQILSVVRSYFLTARSIYHCELPNSLNMQTPLPPVCRILHERYRQLTRQAKDAIIRSA